MLHLHPDDREGLCLTCYSRNANWLIYLQDCLEDAGVDLEAFCEGGGVFILERGRLRLKLGQHCVSMEGIRQFLERMPD